jgi:hypothetical protein
MASIHKDIPIDSPAHEVWDAVRDFGALHTRLVPGFVLDTKLDGDVRIVTFANGTIAREQLVGSDDARQRQRAAEAAFGLGADRRRWRGTLPHAVDHGRAAARDRALHQRADGHGRGCRAARVCESAGVSSVKHLRASPYPHL